MTAIASIQQDLPQFSGLLLGEKPKSKMALPELQTGPYLLGVALIFLCVVIPLGLMVFKNRRCLKEWMNAKR